MIAQPRAGGAGEHRVEAVAHEPEEDEHEAEHDDLQRDRAPPDVDELRQEGEEEERRLRVEDVDDDRLPEDPAERARVGAGRRAVAAPVEQPARTEIDQVRRARELHGLERARRGDEQRREADGGGGHVDEAADVQAERRDEPGAPPARDALRDDVEHGRARDHEQRSAAAAKRASVAGSGMARRYRHPRTRDRAPTRRLPIPRQTHLRLGLDNREGNRCSESS